MEIPYFVYFENTTSTIYGINVAAMLLYITIKNV